MNNSKKFNLKFFNEDSQKRKGSNNNNHTRNRLNSTTSSNFTREKSLSKVKLTMHEVFSNKSIENKIMNRRQNMPGNKIKREIDILNKTIFKEKDEKPNRKFSRNRPMINLDKPEFSFYSKDYLSRSPSLNLKKLTCNSNNKIKINNLKNFNECLFSTRLQTKIEYDNFESEMKRKNNDSYWEKFSPTSKRSSKSNNLMLR